MQYQLSDVCLGDIDMLVRQCELPAMSRDPLKMIMFPNADPSPEEEEEETKWSIEYLQESLQNDSCYFRKVTDSSGCYAGFAIWTLDPSSTVTGHKTKSTQKRCESWNPASLDVRAWIEVSNLLREERQRVLNGQHNIWSKSTTISIRNRPKSCVRIKYDIGDTRASKTGCWIYADAVGLR
jgi:hypothetical protein